MDIKQTEQTRRLVEVTALLALSLHTGYSNVKVIRALEAYAFPEDINLEKEPAGFFGLNDASIVFGDEK